MPFRKAKGEQAALKIGIYGPPGSGKSFTSLLIAEGLARQSGKRIAYKDTEHGTDFYAQHVAARQVHPEAFDFDADYSRSITQCLADIKALSEDTYGVVVIDSMTHLWEAAKASYRGSLGPQGQIPMWAWQKIKGPYKELMNLLLNSKMHVIICGRQGVDYAADEDGETKAVGYKMKAEGETAYEPHILIRMEAVKVIPKKGQHVKVNSDVPTAFIEKDRTGILFGKVFQNPTYRDIAEPLLGLLGDKQAQIASDDDTAESDGNALAAAESAKRKESADLLIKFTARLQLAANAREVEAIGKEITPQLKKRMVARDVDALREAFLAARQKHKGQEDGTSRLVPFVMADIKDEAARVGLDEAGVNAMFLEIGVEVPEKSNVLQARDVLSVLKGMPNATPKA